MVLCGPPAHVGADLSDQLQRGLRPDGMDLAQVSTASEHMQRSADVELQALAVGPPWPANDSLLDDAVCCEPFSASNSPDHQGKYREFS